MTAMKATTVANFPSMVGVKSLSELPLPLRDHMKPVALAVLVSVTVVHGLPAQNPETTRTQPIRGRVVDARNDVPLRRARVVVSVAERRIDTGFTDDEGRFAIANRPAAPLTVRASKAGYAVSLVTLPGGGAGTDLRFAMTKSAAVSGRVLDSSGEPAFAAYVRAQRILPPDGTAQSESTQLFTQTDLLGEYRLGDLPAGRYAIVAVRVRPDKRLPNARPEEQLFGPPESLELARATIMSLDAGDEARDVDFSIAGASDTCPTGPSVRPAPGSVTASIVGRVMAATGEPIACAAVRLVTPDEGIPAVYTDRQGRYAIEGLPAGSFIVEARKYGYPSTQYGQRHPSDAETPIALREGQRRTGTDIVLPSPSIISGTIVDEYGEPIEGIPVWAFQLRHNEGRFMAVSTASPRATDDRGQYRLIGLEPGAYLVAAMGREHVSDGDAQRARGYSPRYYPGVSDASVAQRVRLAAGSSALGVDIALTPTNTAIVSGSIVNSAGQPFPGAVTLEVSGRSGGVAIDSRSAVADANGRFVIPNVPPGDYVAKASDGFGSTTQFGMQYVTVIDGDPAPLRIVLSGGATLEGRIAIDGVSEPNIAGLGVSVSPVESDYAPSGRRMPTMWARQADNTFRATGVTGPNRLNITETPACESCYLKSALVNGTDAADRAFEFGVAGGVYRDVEIVVSDAGAAVEARAIDSSNETATSFTLVVFSTARELWYPQSRHLKTKRSGGDGAARVTGLPPGDYYVAAVNRFQSGPLGGELSDPDILYQLAQGARQVTLNERDRRTLTLRLVRRQGNQP